MKATERYYPYVISVVIGLVWYFINRGNTAIAIYRFDIIMSSVITACLTTIGFILAIYAVFVGLVNTRIIKAVKENNGVGLLNEYLISPLIISSILTVQAFYLSFITLEDNKISTIQFSILLLLAFMLVLSLVRLGFSFILIFNALVSSIDNGAVQHDVVRPVEPDALFVRPTENE